MDKIDPIPRFATLEARVSIIEKFHWPHENWMQDWPLEVSEQIDLASCLKEYPNLFNA